MTVQQLKGDVDGNKLGPPHYGNQIQEQIQQIEALLRPVACQPQAKGLGSAVSTLTAWEKRHAHDLSPIVEAG